MLGCSWATLAWRTLPRKHLSQILTCMFYRTPPNEGVGYYSLYIWSTRRRILGLFCSYKRKIHKCKKMKKWMFSKVKKNKTCSGTENSRVMTSFHTTYLNMKPQEFIVWRGVLQCQYLMFWWSNLSDVSLNMDMRIM